MTVPKTVGVPDSVHVRSRIFNFEANVEFRRRVIQFLTATSYRPLISALPDLSEAFPPTVPRTAEFFSSTQ